jgi:non-heme chloroperoxidase
MMGGAKMLKNGTLKTCSGCPHDMPLTQAETIDADLLTFLRA